MHCRNADFEIHYKESFLNKTLAIDGNPPPQQNSVLWNAMVHPLLNMTIKGVIWYQGKRLVP